MQRSGKSQIVYEAIRKTIREGQRASGDKLPTENELALAYGISRQTIRQALGKLQKDGYILKKQGSGSYVSSAMACAKKTRHIAVITTYISSYIFPSILHGIDEVASEKSYTLMLMATNNSMAKEREILQKLSVDSVDGIIAEGTKTALPSPNLPFFRELAGRHIPMVFFNAYYPDLFTPQPESAVYVVADDYHGSYDQTTALIQKGHHSIGGIFKSDDIQGIRRFSGYIAALSDNGIPFVDDYCMWFTTESSGIIARMLGIAKAILSECTALVCYNDETTVQVLSAMQGTPHSVSEIRSFDHAFPLGTEGVKVYSAGHPREEMGVAVATKLFSLIDGGVETNLVMPWKAPDAPATFSPGTQSPATEP
jgi:GntR family transcriptional regulator of arabinose operon